MKLSEFYEIVNGVAPKKLSDEYCEKFDAYDNSGVLVDTGEEICGALFSLDFSLSAIEQAIATGANLIVTHHPAIYGKISDVNVSEFSPLGKKLVKALRNGISVISMHLNLDCVSGGIDESLMQGVCAAAGENKGAGMRSMQIMRPVSEKNSCGYGRVYTVETTTLGALADNLKRVFATDRILRYGDAEKKICRVASFCGGGADEGAVEFAVKNGADVMISSDFKHHVLTLAKETGIAVLSLTHYAAENYGFEKFYQKIRERVAIPCTYHTERDLL